MESILISEVNVGRQVIVGYELTVHRDMLMGREVSIYREVTVGMGVMEAENNCRLEFITWEVNI